MTATRRLTHGPEKTSAKFLGVTTKTSPQKQKAKNQTKEKFFKNLCRYFIITIIQRINNIKTLLAVETSNHFQIFSKNTGLRCSTHDATKMDE